MTMTMTTMIAMELPNEAGETRVAEPISTLALFRGETFAHDVEVETERARARFYDRVSCSEREANSWLQEG